MIGLWLRGLLRRSPGRLLGVALGVAAAVALLATLGSFLAASKSTMTRQAVAGVVVDQQVALAPGDVGAALAAVRAEAGTRTALPVGYATSSGLTATAGGSTQTTGSAVVLGLPSDYSTTFPGQLRLLTGTGLQGGVLLAQQTASNLHAAVGDTVSIRRAGLPAVPVQVAAVVDLPQANSLFQTVGAPPGAQPAAPPDNVVLLPEAQWRSLFDPLAAARPDLVTTQVHVLRTHGLPADPAAAYAAETSAANHLSADLAGRGTVADNLAASLGAARKDALYAQVLFVFLGLPGAVLAGLLTAAVASSGAARRRSQQSLLRARGATSAQSLRLATVEAALVGAAGTVLGLAVAAAVGASAFGSLTSGASGRTAALTAGLSALVGLGIAAASVLVPARRDLREATVVSGRATVGRARQPRWLRYGLDLLLLGGAAVVYAITSASGYTLVLAPEGVASISVDYWAFAGPALLWAGSALLAWRLVDLLLRRGGRLLTAVLRPVAGPLASTVSASLRRQRRLVTRGAVLLALAVAFAISTAVFNATYATQAEADARLTNGADVTVTTSPGSAAPAGLDAQLAAVPGVRHVEQLQHRFAYIGTDLQDLYGVDAATIAASTSLQDAYFTGGTARQLLARLQARPDAVLVSAETVKDYRLNVGDPVMLRLRDRATQALRPVRFTYVGVVKEFPTAPKDSFFVTNAAYVAASTGDPSVGAYLLDAGAGQVRSVAASARALVGTSAAVTDIATTRTAVGSSLTAVDLSGLTRVELAFALVLAAAGGGLLLALGLAERRRAFAIASALGANRRQVAGFLWGEALVVLAGGLLTGALLGGVLAQMLVTVLTGVFDPPPAGLSVPWVYLTATGALALAAVGAAVAVTGRLARRPPLTVLRDL